MRSLPVQSVVISIVVSLPREARFLRYKSYMLSGNEAMLTTLPRLIKIQVE